MVTQKQKKKKSRILCYTISNKEYEPYLFVYNTHPNFELWNSRKNIFV